MADLSGTWFSPLLSGWFASYSPRCLPVLKPHVSGVEGLSDGHQVAGGSLQVGLGCRCHRG